MGAEDNSGINAADTLRDQRSAREPDPRSAGQVLENHLAAIRRYALRPEVPEQVRIHFDTARNLYLYAWFVYRFYMAAEQYVYTTLELALRTRLHPELGENDRKPGLKKLLEEAIDSGLLANRRFSRVVWMAERRARDRQSHELMKRMIEEGLTQIVVPDDVDVLDEDFAFDALDIWKNSIPDFRNLHAHGHTSLWPQVLGTFEIVSEMINLIYEPR